MIRVFGQITDASGKGVPGAMIELRALKSTAEVLYGSVLPYKCDALGNYDFPLAIGAYDAYAQNDACGDMDYLGTAVVASNTTDGDLYHLLVDGGVSIIPPMLESAMEYTRRAEQAADAAEADREQTGKDVAITAQNRQASETKAQESAASAGEAKAARDSIVNDAADVRAKAKQVADDAASVANNTAAVQRNTDQVAQNTQTVSVKAQQVSENTQSVAANALSVTQMRDEVAAKTSMAQGAADTATQKAASAAGHDAAAAEYARQAQEAAQATAGALIDGGAVNLSGGVYPQPVMVGSIKRPTFWKVTTGGGVGGVDYGVGDTLIYTTSDGGSYYKIDNTESVTSVQGEKGAVTLTPEKIGAEAAGTAAAMVNQHKSEQSAHTPQQVGADPSGTAAKLIALLKTEGDPFPQYLVTGDFGIGGVEVNKITDLSVLAHSGFYHTDASSMGEVGESISYHAIYNMISKNAGLRVTCQFDDIKKLAVGLYYGGAWRVARLYHSLNTAVDANGFIKRASPIARLYGNETSAKRDSEYMVSGCAAVNHEAEGVSAMREAVGLYRVTGSLGFAEDGWCIETPSDVNGNKLLFVEYEQCSNGDIIAKTFAPDYSSGRCAAGEPKDIPDGRWIDLRLSMPIAE